MSDVLRQNNWQVSFPVLASIMLRRQVQPEAPIMVKFYPSRIANDYSNNSRIIQIKNSGTFIEKKINVPSRVTQLRISGYDVEDNSTSEIESLHAYLRLVNSEDSERNSNKSIEKLMELLCLYRWGNDRVMLTDNLSGHSVAYNYSGSCSIDRFKYDTPKYDEVSHILQLSTIWLQEDSINRVVVNEILEAMYSTSNMVHHKIGTQFDTVIRDVLRKNRPADCFSILVAFDHGSTGREAWSIYNCICLIYDIPVPLQLSIILEIALLTCQIMIANHNPSTNWGIPVEANTNISNNIIVQLIKITKVRFIKDLYSNFEKLAKTFKNSTENYKECKAIKVKIRPYHDLYEQWCDTKTIYEFSEHINKLAMCYLINAAVKAEIITSGIESRHAAVLDTDVIDSKILRYSMRREENSAAICQEYNVKCEHDTIYILYGEFVSYSLRCIVGEQWDHQRIWNDVYFEGGMYQKTPMVALVLIISAALIILLPLFMLVLQHYDKITVQFDITSFGSWLAVLYGGALVIIQNTWLENWSWYDLVRARRLIVEMSDIKDKLDMQMKQLHLVIMMIESSRWVQMMFSDVSTCGNRLEGLGKTNSCIGVTAQAFDWAGISVIQKGENSKIMVQAQPVQMNSNNDELSEYWHECTNQGRVMHIGLEAKQCTGASMIIYGNMEFRGNDRSDLYLCKAYSHHD